MLTEAKTNWCQRDSILFAKWAVDRINLEHEAWKAADNPQTPVQIMMDIEFGSRILDQMLVRVVERAKWWGKDCEIEARKSLIMVEDVIHEIQIGELR